MSPPRALWPRLHLFELLDQEWYPAALRDHCTNYLATLSQRVSALRAHRPEELRRMTESLTREGYTWEVGVARVPGKPPVTYVLGLPVLRFNEEALS